MRLDSVVDLQSAITRGEQIQHVPVLILEVCWIEPATPDMLLPIAGGVVDVREHRECLTVADEAGDFQQVVPDDARGRLILQQLRNLDELAVQHQPVQGAKHEFEPPGGDQIACLFRVPMRLAQFDAADDPQVGKLSRHVWRQLRYPSTSIGAGVRTPSA